MLPITFPRVLKPFACDNLIRLGTVNDGGYLVNKEDVLKTDMLLSFGIGTDVSFETDFISHKDVPLEAYDNSVDGDFTLFDKYKHIKKHVTTEDTDTTAAISTILANAPHATFLKCDIEGGEYPILDEIIRHSDKLTGAVFEFHDLHNPENYGLLVDFMSKLGLRLIHTHINNYGCYVQDNRVIPTVIEITFTSSKNIALEDVVLPNPLDSPNNANAPEYEITFV